MFEICVPGEDKNNNANNMIEARVGSDWDSYFGIFVCGVCDLCVPITFGLIFMAQGY